MSIKIAERLRPFSHVPGVSCLVPKTKVVVQIFPTLLRFENGQEISLDLEGPIKKFTVEQDLEKGRLCIFGHSKQGYFRYFIFQDKEEIKIHFDKFPLPLAPISISNPFEEVQESKERLSLGMHKAQDWEMIRRRSDLKEIFPLWIKLAGLTPDIVSSAHPLLLSCEELIERGSKLTIYESFLSFYLAGFYDMLVPRLQDNQHQGFAPYMEKGSPHFLLKKGASLIRALFFQEQEGLFSLLPCLPPEFHAGRYLNLKTSCGEVDLEWSKKMLRRVTLRIDREAKIRLELPKGIKSYRLRKSFQEHGLSISAEEALSLSPGTFFLDRFTR